MRLSRRPAFTLVETLIHSVLLLLLLGGVVTALILGSRNFRMVEALADVQREAAAAGAALRQELAETRGASVAVGTSPAGVVFLSPRPDGTGPWLVDADGSLLWQRWVCYYLDTRNGVPVLLRKERKLNSPTANPPTTTLTTADFRADSSVARVVARWVAALQVTAGSPLEVRLEVERASALGRKERLVILESVGPRNP